MLVQIDREGICVLADSVNWGKSMEENLKRAQEKFLGPFLHSRCSNRERNQGRQAAFLIFSSRTEGTKRFP